MNIMRSFVHSQDEYEDEGAEELYERLIQAYRNRIEILTYDFLKGSFDRRQEANSRVDVGGREHSHSGHSNPSLG